jgi:hypothetical protein
MQRIRLGSVFGLAGIVPAVLLSSRYWRPGPVSRLVAVFETHIVSEPRCVMYTEEVTKYGKPYTTSVNRTKEVQKTVPVTRLVKASDD